MTTPTHFAITSHLLGAIKDFWVLSNALLDGVWTLLERGFIVRRASLAAAWVITFKSYWWCFEAAEASDYDPATIAAVFAILTPVSGLLALVLKIYGTNAKDRPRVGAQAKRDPAQRPGQLAGRTRDAFCYGGEENSMNKSTKKEDSE